MRTHNTPIHIIVFFFLIACTKNDDFEPNIVDIPSGNGNTGETISPNRQTLRWISANMNEFYLWNDHFPSEADSTQKPINFYSSLLYKYGTYDGDRYSQIISLADGNLMQNNPTAGYDFVLLGVPNTSNIYGYINYVVKNSPAESAGLKRGDLFLKINGEQLTRTNYLNLTNQTTALHKLTMAVINEKSVLIPDKEISVSVTYLNEEPIYLDTIYTINGVKIAYLIYNSFTPDAGNNTKAYDYQLNRLFGKYKSEGVTNLVLDLRYNGGGELTSAVYLASMILNASHVNDVFVKHLYNKNLQSKYLQEYGEEYFINRFTNSIDGTPINHLGLNRIYILMSYRTAAASELLINGLKPYIDVILIGRGETEGRNVGTVDIESGNTEIPWLLRPTVVKFSNSENYDDYPTGFPANIYQNEYNVFDTKALGDTEEILLASAISQITGVTNNTSLINKNEAMTEPIAYSDVILNPYKQTVSIGKVTKGFSN